MSKDIKDTSTENKKVQSSKKVHTQKKKKKKNNYKWNSICAIYF